MNKKITGLRVLELKKRIKIKEDNKLYFKYLIHNLNFKLSKSSILGIFSSDSETKKMILIFWLIIRFKKMSIKGLLNLIKKIINIF